MVRPIIIKGFRGMNNIPGAMPSTLVDDVGRTAPRILLNVESCDGGAIRQRGGYKKQISLPECHSLWAGSVKLVVTAGVLSRVDGLQVTPLATLDGPRTPLCYFELSNRVFISNPYWSAVYDLLKGSVGAWGVPLPAAPDVTLVTGDLAPGGYVLGYTQMVNGDLSGNGPLVKVSWEGAPRGIRLNNLPAGGQCWITHPDGSKLLLADTAGDTITGQVPQAKPLPSFHVSPPPPFSHFAHAFGRIWGCSGSKLLFSNPFHPTWFDGHQFIPFPKDLVMVAPVEKGIFVNSRMDTWFLDGTNPNEMEFTRIGDGAVPGSLVYASLPGALVGGGNEQSRRLVEFPSPVWMSKNGFCTGTQTGKLVHLTESRLQITPRTAGASVYFLANGIPRVISSMSGPPANAEQDDFVGPILTMGRLFPPAPVSGIAAGGFSLEGTCITA